MKKLRELFSDTLIYGISSVFARFINYLLVPLYTDVFNPAEYGIVGLVYSAIAMLNVLFTMGMESSYLRYAKDRERARSYFKTLQLFLLGISLILVLIILLIKPVFASILGLGEGNSIYLMMLGILLFDTLSIISFAELRLVRKSVLFAVLKTGNIGISLGLNFYLILGLGFGIEAIFISNLAASAITALVVWGITSPMLIGKWDRAILKKALVFGLPFIPAGIGYVINEMLDRFFLNGMSSESLNTIYGAGFTAEYIVGVYNACYKLAVFMLLLVQMFRMAWQPFFMRHSDDPAAPKLYAHTFTFFNGSAAIIFLCISLFLEQIVSIKIPVLNAFLIGREYWMGLSVVPFLLMAYWFQGWYVNFSAGIFISEKTKKLAQITLIGAGVTILINLILVPRMGMMGSAVATVTSYTVMAFYIYHYSQKAFQVPYDILSGISVIVIASGTVFLKDFLSIPFFSDITGTMLLFVSALLLIGAISYISYLKVEKS